MGYSNKIFIGEPLCVALDHRGAHAFGKSLCSKASLSVAALPGSSSSESLEAGFEKGRGSCAHAKGESGYPILGQQLRGSYPSLVPASVREVWRNYGALCG